MSTPLPSRPAAPAPGADRAVPHPGSHAGAPPGTARRETRGLVLLAAGAVTLCLLTAIGFNLVVSHELRSGFADAQRSAAPAAPTPSAPSTSAPAGMTPAPAASDAAAGARTEAAAGSGGGTPASDATATGAAGAGAAPASTSAGAPVGPADAGHAPEGSNGPQTPAR
ncbi:hypothetical protein B2J86_09270 [Acidovorax sp. SRB_14]|uniref:hypothetical protein n=1 Tax=Acidovorax sp. SRB_14 TaxID=1962699 RepID=UPI001566E92B|nr:hypothetical protein [Acidovorax sp. SRB_14]NMM81109.1 hypothetical protein [Acidovorax sp. SRB_14]